MTCKNAEAINVVSISKAAPSEKHVICVERDLVFYLWDLDITLELVQGIIRLLANHFSINILKT